MATSESEAAVDPKSVTAAPIVKIRPKKGDSVLDKALGLLSSVRFGVTMLMIVLVCAMIGMLIVQTDVDKFSEYFARLTPAQKYIYGKLGFFNIYHSRYFALFLAITGLNIILASIDRFPTAWQYVVKPKRTASPKFIQAQSFNAESEIREDTRGATDSVSAAFRKQGFRPKVVEEGGRTTIFGQKNVWNRLGAYSVHVALLTIFTGGFITSKLGVGGVLEIVPGKSANTITTREVQLDGDHFGNAQLPFNVECVDIQQKLIRPEGGLDASNTIDWYSRIKIKDRGRDVSGLVHLNEPFDHAGYRFFQSFFMGRGHAREITVQFTPKEGGNPIEVTIKRDGSADVPGIGHVAYTNFFPDFTIEGGKPSTASGDYNNPAAQLQVTAPDGKSRTLFAFTPETADQFLSKNDKDAEGVLLIDGKKVLLKSFEKVATSHTLTVQYDPGRVPVYTGFILLVLSLCGVFLFSHQRVWAVIEPEGSGAHVYLGGNTNRNKPGFEARFNSVVESVSGKRGADNE
ncbi:MAG: hypothetical protein DMF61_16980 [Blastocatellia bacterium AA13]|nr:MAG: hypothetical protein DMF61_16980 [Blastocatellia bacterium AA13]